MCHYLRLLYFQYSNCGLIDNHGLIDLVPKAKVHLIIAFQNFYEWLIGSVLTTKVIGMIISIWLEPSVLELKTSFYN